VNKEHDSHSPVDTNKHTGDVTVKGGDEQIEMSTGKWMDSVRDWKAWRVIEYVEVQPVYTLLDKGRCDMITGLLAIPEAPKPNYLPMMTTLHIISHQGNNMSYPISIIHEKARMTCLEDDAPHKGDGFMSSRFRSQANTTTTSTSLIPMAFKASNSAIMSEVWSRSHW